MLVLRKTNMTLPFVQRKRTAQSAWLYSETGQLNNVAYKATRKLHSRCASTASIVVRLGKQQCSVHLTQLLYNYFISHSA